MSNFWACAHQGDTERLVELLDNGQDIDEYSADSAYRPTALAYAVWGNQPAAVALLLERGANPNRPDGDLNYYPLHWASYHSDHADCAELLVKAGAELNVRSQRGFTPLELAQGLNELVSRKPGVQSVLEEALAEIRGAPRHHSAPLPPLVRPHSPATPRSPRSPRTTSQSPLAQTRSPTQRATAPPAPQPTSPLQPTVPTAAGAGTSAGVGAPVAQQWVTRAPAAPDSSAGRQAGEARPAGAAAAAPAAAEPGRGGLVCGGAAFGALAVAALAAIVAAVRTPDSWAPLVGLLVAAALAGLLLVAKADRLSSLALALKRRRRRRLPSQFLCPITAEVMRDPVATADGHTYERGAIERWLRTHDTSPMTGAALPHKLLTPAISLRQLIADFTDGT